MSNQYGFTDVTSDDKLWAGLSYFFSPIVSIIVLLMEDKKARPYIKYHAVQSLAAGIVIWVVASIIGTFTLGCGFIIYFVMWYWAWKAYKGESFTIPVLTDFIRNQGWV